METPPILLSSTPEIDEERLAHALVSRGLVTREEVQKARASGNGMVGPRSLLDRLVQNGYLTVPQSMRAAEEMEQLLHQQIPGYQLIEKLGEGGMGIVYKARQVSMNRLVAVKILHPRLTLNREFIERFTREAHLAARFSSNHVVQAIDVGSAGPLHYFVMEYVEGKSVQDELDRGKIYRERDALVIVTQIVQALRQARSRFLIHRDIKPANIILTRDNVAKLADLGVARETHDRTLARAEKGMRIGTPNYISPEQVRGEEDIDCRADIYSLGATLYHMVTGQPPYVAPTVKEILLSHLRGKLVPANRLNKHLSVGLVEVIEVMMAKQREDRYQTPDELLADLECLLRGEPPALAEEKLAVAQLAEVEEDDQEEEPRARSVWEERVPVFWFAVIAGLLAVSLLANLILLIRMSWPLTGQ